MTLVVYCFKLLDLKLTWILHIIFDVEVGRISLPITISVLVEAFSIVTTVLLSCLQFTFEQQEGLPAVSDFRQGFLPLKIVQSRV